MESFLPSEIARLVLGYLEETKCPDAYETFLNSCPYLDECVKMKQDGRRFRTQVLGLTLLDILYEYSAIYSLVQERLKKVDPETAESLKSSGSLLDKITFLLNATSSGQTMLFSITLPPGKSPQNSTVAHVRKRLKSTPGDRRKDPRKVVHPQISEVNTYPEVFDNRTGPAVIEATCLNSLPGNNSGTKEGILDCYEHVEDITKTPKRKAQHIRKSRSNSANVEGSDENLDLTMITKALLDNHELHEKIAENINKVIYTPELNTNTVGEPAGQDLLCQQNPVTSELNTNFCVSNNFTMELDNAFKKIVQDTESDPVFEHLLEEVIGAVSEETSDDCDDRGISDTSTPYQSTPEINKKQLLKNRLRSSKLKRSETPLTSSSEVNTPNKIDYQNAAAIESIVLMNANTEHEKSTECNVTVIENTNKELVSVPEEIQKESQLTVTSDTVVVSKPESTVTVTASETKVSTVETVTQPITVATTSAVVTSTTESVTSTASAPMKILPATNSNLIMVSQQNNMPTQSAIVITETFCQQPLFQDNKIIFLSNQVHGIGSQIVAVQPAQFQLSQSTVINDSDILSMPTMIMCGDDRQSAFVPTSIAPKYIGNNTPIYPKGILNEPSTSSSVPVAKAVTKYKPKPKSKQKPTVTTSTCETDTVKFFISVQAETKPIEENVPPDTVQESSNSSASVPEVVPPSVPEVVAPSVPEVVAPSVPMISIESNKKEEPAETEKSITPNKTSDSKVQVNLSSPRNGRSHVRALDFSTPANDNWSGRKATSSPKSRGSKSKSPKSATKNVRENLFKSPIKIVNIPIATRSPMTKLVGDWDQVQGAGLILGKEKSSQKTRNALSDSDLVVQSKTKNKIMETVKKIQRPRRAVTLKSKVLQTSDEGKPTVSTENVDETMNNSNENVKENPIISVERLPLNNESTTKLTNTKRKLDSWDKDLRALVEPVTVPKKKTTVTKKSPIAKKTPKRVVKIPRKRAKRKGANTSTESTKTDVDGLSIEKELEKLEAEKQVEEKEVSKKNDDNKTTDVKVEIIVPKKRRQTKKTKIVVQKGKNIKEVVQSEVDIEVTTQEVEFKKDESVAEENEGSGDNQEQGKEIIADNLRNMKPRYNKKCNVGSAIKKNVQESVQKYVDNNEETKCMTIMSPSKMNANKRTLVEHESNKEYVVEKKETLKVVEMASVIASAPSTCMTSEVLDVSLCKITPDISRPSTSNPITMKCNLTPVLETPMKCDSLLFPVTPKLYTPFSSTDSPFTKLFKDQPGSVDLSCIPTPNFPVTPKFIITPNSQAGDSHSSYASRPTDYSNSSSYYQPSDSEQNQRLEQILIQEAVKNDTNVDVRTVTSPPEKEALSIQKIQPYSKNINYILEETALPCSTAEIVVTHTEFVDVNTETQRESVVQEPMKLLSIETQTYEQDGASIIEPENTSQNRSICTSQYSSDSSSSSSSSTSSSSDSDSSEEEDEKNCSANSTVIPNVIPENTEVKVDPVSERYALRSSTKSTPVPQKEKHEPDSSNDSIKFFIPKKRVSRRLTDTPPLKKTEEESGGQNKALKSNVTRSHKMLLKELDMKRKRVLTVLKTGDDKPKKVNKKVVKSKKIIENNMPVAKPRKGRPRKNTTVKERISKIDSKPVKKKEKSNTTLKKLTSPRKSKTIEAVATRLKEQIPELNEPLNLKVVIPVTSSSNTDKQEEAVLYTSNNTRRDSCGSNSDEKERRHAYTSSIEDEEFPRLHISSDEEDLKSPDPSISEPPATRIREDPQMLVRSLKERGIHLIPKKVTDEKDSTPEKEHLQESRVQEYSVVVDKVEEVDDAQTKLSENGYDMEKINKAVSKGKKIKIRSNVILDEKIDLSKIELSQSVITDTIRGQSSTLNENVHNNDEEKQTSDAPLSLVQEPDKLVECIKETNKREQTLSIYNSSGSTTASEDSFTYEEFNVKIVTENSPEFIKVVHDESIKCQKKISDYNLSDLLTKTIKAKVYIEELDIDQDRHLVITPYLDLLTIPPERKRGITKDANEEPVSSKTRKTCTKPLDILYNELVDDSSGENKLKPNTEVNTDKQDILKIKTREVPSKTKTKVIVQKQTEETSKANESQAGCSIDNQPTTRSTKKTTITLEQYKNKNSKKKIEMAGGPGTDNAYRKSAEESDERVSEENEEDSLMTFAIVGKDETPTQDSNVKKRKATSSIDSSKQTNEKRIKSNDNKALLKVMADIDLDKFLTKVHGPSSQ